MGYDKPLFGAWVSDEVIFSVGEVKKLPKVFENDRPNSRRADSWISQLFLAVLARIRQEKV